MCTNFRRGRRVAHTIPGLGLPQSRDGVGNPEVSMGDASPLPSNNLPRSLNQALAHSKSYSSCPVLAVRFVEDVGEVSGNRFLAEYQLLSDPRVGKSLGYQAQHFYLASSQSCWIEWLSCLK